MKKVTANYGSTEPSAFVTKDRHRVKQYNDSVYLNNGDEFELELFNPTTSKVMAKIELNGISIGAGIVLRPGERVFIERYIEEARKFMFQIYEVNGNNKEVQKAIVNNGDVRVMFYKEQIPYISPSFTTWTTTWPTFGTYTYNNSTVSPTFGGSSITGNVMGMSDSSVMYSSPLNMSDTKDFFPQGCVDSFGTMNFMDNKSSRKMSKSLRSSKPIETGRIDKGSISNQSFGHDYSSFDTYWTWQTKWKILPLSQKPLVSEDIKIFCTNCGTRQKKSTHKFCPNCGTKF
jgi:hypothetical protein